MQQDTLRRAINHLTAQTALNMMNQYCQYIPLNPPSYPPGIQCRYCPSVFPMASSREEHEKVTHGAQLSP